MTRYANGDFKVSYSEMSKFATCKRAWYLSYFRGLQRKKKSISLARDTGIAVHGMAEQFYLHGGLNGETSIEEATKWYDASRTEDLALAEYDAEQLKATSDSYDMAWVVFEGYVQWLEQTGVDAGLTNFRSEDKLEIDGPHGVKLNGRIDLMADDLSDDSLVVMDFKAVDQIGRMVASLTLDQGQGLTYGLLAKMLVAGDRPVKVVWSMLRRSKRTSRAKPPFYQRHELAVNPDMLKAHYERIHGIFGDMLRTEKRLNDGESHQVVAYPAPNGDCSWKCEFSNVCGLMNDPRTDVEWIFENHFEPRISPNLPESSPDAATLETTQSTPVSLSPTPTEGE